MAVVQMALPIERRNGASATPPGPAPMVEVVAPAAEAAAVPVPVWVGRITTAAVLAVAGVAAIASYEHMRALAAAAGEGWRSWLLPISVDGLAVAASMTMLVRRRAGQCAGGCCRGRRCCWAWARPSLRMSRRRSPQSWGGWWRPGPRWGSCSHTTC